eukprot:95701-Prymnesium_polylepis.2
MRGTADGMTASRPAAPPPRKQHPTEATSRESNAPRKQDHPRARGEGEGAACLARRTCRRLARRLKERRRDLSLQPRRLRLTHWLAAGRAAGRRPLLGRARLGRRLPSL